MNRIPTITAAIVALNEEQNLPGLLERLDWADEVIVVDGGSSDGTVHVAHSHGAKLYERPFDNFARQRNHALSLAGGDWVLSIDADERPTPALVHEIRARLPFCRQVAFRVPIRSSIFGRRLRFSGTQDDRPVRLFRRGFACWTGEVHEVLETFGPVGRLQGWIEHRTLPDLPSFLAKMGRYTTLEAEARMAAGCRPRPHDAWTAPARETLRRLLWKQGLFDGPEGWAFSLLSGLSEWVLTHKHRRMWHAGTST